MSEAWYLSRREGLLRRLRQSGLPYPARVWPYLYPRIARYRPCQLRSMRLALEKVTHG